MFEAEALGLGAMYETRTISVPKPFKVCKFDFVNIKVALFIVDISSLFGSKA